VQHGPQSFQKKMYRMTVGKLAWESWTWLAQHGFVLKARSGTRDRDNDALGILAGLPPITVSTQ
jgi:hypothetical protein